MAQGRRRTLSVCRDTFARGIEKLGKEQNRTYKSPSGRKKKTFDGDGNANLKKKRVGGSLKTRHRKSLSQPHREPRRRFLLPSFVLMGADREGGSEKSINEFDCSPLSFALSHSTRWLAHLTHAALLNRLDGWCRFYYDSYSNEINARQQMKCRCVHLETASQSMQ